MICDTIITAELAQLSLCYVTDADTVAENDEAAAAAVEMLSQIYRGHETDPWFATANHTAHLDIYQGLYYKGDVLVVPDIHELKRTIMHELHDANYAGHVGSHRSIHSVQRMYWWPGMHAAIREYMRGCKICQQDKLLQRQPAGKLVPLQLF